LRRATRNRGGNARGSHLFEDALEEKVGRTAGVVRGLGEFRRAMAPDQVEERRGIRNAFALEGRDFAIEAEQFGGGGILRFQLGGALDAAVPGGAHHRPVTR